MPMLHNGLHANLSVHKWQLPLVSSIITSPCILKRKTIISSILMCYATFHNINNFPLEKVTYVDEYN